MLTRQSGCIPAGYYAGCSQHLIKASFFAPVVLNRRREINRSRVQKRVMAGDLKQASCFYATRCQHPDRFRTVHS